MFERRRYQERSVDALRESYRTGHRAPVFVLPTGGGKTIVFVAVTSGARAKGKRVLVVAHRRELIRQAAAKLELTGVTPGIICPGFKPQPDELVQVASIQTVARRLHAMPAFDLVVIDEAHHSVAGQYRKLLASQPQAKLLGVTATPLRLDGKGLGVEHGGCFDDIIVGANIRELVAQGYLAQCRVFTAERKIDLDRVRVRHGDYAQDDLARVMSDPKIVGDCVEQYRAHADRRSAICFCVSVQHAEEVAQSFRDAGYRAICVHGDSPTHERDGAIAGLGTGEVEVLTSCDLISEGLDVPAVGAVILLRPTKSLGLYMQQVGRGMRPAEGKDCLMVLDHVGNVAKHGPPDLERIWSLAGIEKSVGAQRECDGEGHGRGWDQADGELVEITADRLQQICAMPYAQVIRSRLSELELQVYAAHHGYRPGWVWHRLQDQAS